MSYILMLLTLVTLVSCASRKPSSADEMTWKESDERMDRAEFINRSY